VGQTISIIRSVYFVIRSYCFIEQCVCKADGVLDVVKLKKKKKCPARTHASVFSPKHSFLHSPFLLFGWET